MEMLLDTRTSVLADLGVPAVTESISLSFLKVSIGHWLELTYSTRRKSVDLVII
jgi:hypothetical protein